MEAHKRGMDDQRKAMETQQKTAEDKLKFMEEKLTGMLTLVIQQSADSQSELQKTMAQQQRDILKMSNILQRLAENSGMVQSPIRKKRASAKTATREPNELDEDESFTPERHHRSGKAMSRLREDMDAEDSDSDESYYAGGRGRRSGKSSQQ